jgi:hypothetical protein
MNTNRNKINEHGLLFEIKTASDKYMETDGFKKYGMVKKKNGEYKITNSNKRKKNYFLQKDFDDKKIIYCYKNNFKKYVLIKYGIEIFRLPDEAYIIEFKDGRKVIKIVEKKYQTVGGSVETKLWGCPALKKEYEIVFGNSFEIQYSLCVSNYLKTKLESQHKKYCILMKIFKEYNISVLYGENSTYIDELKSWYMF